MNPEATSQRWVLGPYQLGLLLGAGGMGEVYKAYDDRLERWVAAKRVRSDAPASARKRFRHEARILATLGHPGIVQIFDIVEAEDGDWIVMELIDGPTLSELCRDGPFDLGLGLDCGHQIASALEAAHSSGIVHRDLKTENVMLLPSGHVKVLDFGLARRTRSLSSEVTVGERLEDPSEDPSEAVLSQSGRIVGTPRAMSPEQVNGEEVDARSDLFSFGVLLYEMLTARSPFAGRTAVDAMVRVLTHQPPPAKHFVPQLSRRLSALIDHLLEKAPACRPQSAAAVKAELAAIAVENPGYGMASGAPSQLEILNGEVGDSGVASQDETLQESLSEVVVKTLLISGLVGSTQLVAELGDREAAALFRRHDRLVRDLLVEHGGREVEKSDLFLLLFERPWAATSYALVYHERLGELGLTARVGIHLGEVILHKNAAWNVNRGARPFEVEGLAKPTAARLMSLASGGQTLLTRAAYDVARRSSVSEGDLALEWLCHGRYRFQGIDGEMEIFEVGLSGMAPLVAPDGSGKVRRVEGDRALRQDPQVQPMGLRSWPPLELPAQPYPVLLPYTHPELMAGRDAEIARLRRLLEMPVPILGLSAPSGTGKSSLLVGGLVPTLRAAGQPVAFVRHPAEAGVASRLIGDLLEGGEELAEDDALGFVERLAEVERLSGTAPVLVLDQFEDLLTEDGVAARRVLGILMAASVGRRPGFGGPPCRWLIAYRREFFGGLTSWLRDVLVEARRVGFSGLESFPQDLSQPERFQSMTLLPLATPSPGSRERLGEATEVFLAAIEKPLEGSSFPWSFPAGHAERLAGAFAAARLERPDAPLAPELQVVLAHLLAEAGSDGRINVPEDPGPMIEEALDEHLRRALEAAFPQGASESATRRARALLALRELATDSGQRGEGLRPEELARAIGDEGEAILEKLATPLTRLVVVREAADGLRWVLAHDRMAEAVVRLVEEEGRQGGLLVDTELLALRRFVTLRTALYEAGEVGAATQVPWRRFRRITRYGPALLWDEDRRAWFAACRKRRLGDRGRLVGFVAMVVVVLGLIGWEASSRARQQVEHRQLVEQMGSYPELAFKALDQLATRPDADLGELLALLRQREDTMDVLEFGLSGLDGSERSAAVLRAVEIALPWVDETPEDPVLIANLVWALDYAPGRDPPFVEKARALRDRVLEPLRRLRPPPPFPDSLDPDWIHVPAGSFLMGIGPDDEGSKNEHPQHEVFVSAFRMLRHEVTYAEYRRLVPDHRPEEGDKFPAAYVSWYDAYTYAAWMRGRLPTEAEWEYAARADCPYAYCAGDGLETTVDIVAWAKPNSRDVLTGELASQPVMQLEPNPWGFYDMLGNLMEWTTDWYGSYADHPQYDPWGQAVPPYYHGGSSQSVSFRYSRISRGQFFGNSHMRVASRGLAISNAKKSGCGIRVVLQRVLGHVRGSDRSDLGS